MIRYLNLPGRVLSDLEISQAEYDSLVYEEEEDIPETIPESYIEEDELEDLAFGKVEEPQVEEEEVNGPLPSIGDVDGSMENPNTPKGNSVEVQSSAVPDATEKTAKDSESEKVAENTVSKAAETKQETIQKPVETNQTAAAPVKAAQPAANNEFVTAAKTRMDFGKYKGLTIEEVAEKDLPYLQWLIDNASANRPCCVAIRTYLREKK
jgi:hypothetical protein